jgi:hypothetical protein
MRNAYKVLVRNMKERDHVGDPALDRRICSDMSEGNRM